MNKRILFVSHAKAHCGVYEFGKSISDVLQHSKKYDFIRVECSSLQELKTAINENNPEAIIYNYYPSVLPWITTEIKYNWWVNNITSFRIPQIGIIHEVTQQVADRAVNYKSKILLNSITHLSSSLFDFYIAPDPTLLLRNPFVYKTGRLIPKYKNNFPLPSKPVIGSFGFATPRKGFEKIVQLVQQEFDEAIIRFNIPSADFTDEKGGDKSRELGEKCMSLISKPGIKFVLTHDFMDTTGMLDFLAKNTVNVFLYEHDAASGRGISSAVDNAMAVGRPIAISEAVMFRHLFDTSPSICVSQCDLKTIIKNGFAPLQKHYNEWNAENLVWEYERIMDSIFAKMSEPSKTNVNLCRTIRSKFGKILTIPNNSFTWLRNSERRTMEDGLIVDQSARYSPIQIPGNPSLNCILDDNARIMYAPAIKILFELVPKTMAKKIPEANVQQAFVFDTVYRFLSNYVNPKILCVGSYEDTASMSLIKMGYQIEEVDPTLNYSLQEYFTKPTTIRNSYNIVFATSVIEHVPDDESFMKCISDLLAPDGIAVITCDYLDGWKLNEPKPDCNTRFYTQHDLRDRLLSSMTDCYLIDKPRWDCLNPDFNYRGKYRYTFATFVVKKQMNR